VYKIQKMFISSSLFSQINVVAWGVDESKKLDVALCNYGLWDVIYKLKLEQYFCEMVSYFTQIFLSKFVKHEEVKKREQYKKYS